MDCPLAKIVATFVKTFPGAEDYAWTSNGVLLMAKGSKLFARKVANGSDDHAT